MSSFRRPGIGVRLAPRVEAGEFLADARALDAAGAAALWIDGAEDPWLLLAAAAVVTAHVRLVAPCSAAEVEAPDRLARRVATLQLLARNRIVLAVDDAALVGPVSACADVPLWFDVQTSAPPLDAAAVVRTARGWLLPGRVPADLHADREAVQVARRAQGLDAELEFWAGVPVPAGRAEWRRLLAENSAAGATGVVVPHDPRLLDLLRNPDSDGNRSDMRLAQG